MFVIDVMILSDLSDFFVLTIKNIDYRVYITGIDKFAVFIFKKF